MPQDNHSNVLQDTICKTLPLIGQEVVAEDLHACNQMSNCERVIVSFKDVRIKIKLKCASKTEKFTSEIFRNLRLKSSGKLFLS